MPANTEWFRKCGWGVFTHYLADKDFPAEGWNRQVEAFDVDRLADQLESVGAGYYFVTIGQNSGHYCAPNATYDAIVGTRRKCSERDLIADLYDALEPRGIALLVYLPSGAPAHDALAVERLEWEWGFEGGWPAVGGTGTSGKKRTGKRLASFQLKWEAIIREWSLRWAGNVKGWWIDGCYFADEMYRHPDPPNFASFVAALRAGNPDAIVAFNPGVVVPVISMTEHEDYTAGEIAHALPVHDIYRPLTSTVDGSQFHILSFLGEAWCTGVPRFSDELVVGYTRHIIEHGGVITWDVPIAENGLIPEPFLEQLGCLRTLRE